MRIVKNNNNNNNNNIFIEDFSYNIAAILQPKGILVRHITLFSASSSLRSLTDHVSPYYIQCSRTLGIPMQ